MGRRSAVDGSAIVILLTLRDLRHRFVRFAVVTVLGAVVFTLLFVMTGLVEQFHREPVDTVDALGASTWVLPQGISGPFTAAAPFSTDAVAVVDADEFAPVIVGRAAVAQDGSEDVVLIGHEVDALGSPPIDEGRPVAAPGELVADDSLDVDIGDRVMIAGTELAVVGLTSDSTLLAGIPLVFTELTQAQDLVYDNRGVVSAVLASGEVRAIPQGTVATSAAGVADSALEPLDGAIASVDLVRVLLWIVAAVIIGAVVYLSALERLRDFAVLKAIGASNRSLLGSLALQAVLVALLAVALAAVLQLFLAPAFPLKVSVPTRAFWQLPLIAVGVALLAGLAGMRRVANSDPALAFSGASG